MRLGGGSARSRSRCQRVDDRRKYPPRGENYRLREGADPGPGTSGHVDHLQVRVEHYYSGGPQPGHIPASWGHNAQAAPQCGTQAGINAGEKVEVLLAKGPVAAVAVGLNPSPAPEHITGRDHRDITNAGRPHDLVPAGRAREISAGLGAERSRRVGTASQHVFGREIAAGVLQLKHPGNLGPEVVLGNATQRQQCRRVGDGPAPAIEADHALQLGDRFELDRLAIECRGAEPLKPLPAPGQLPVGPPHTTTIRRPPANPTGAGVLPCRSGG